MSINQITNSPFSSSIPFSILDLKAQAVRLPVSKGGQILLSELLTWAGERGYCWWSVPKIAKDLGWSVSSVWRRSAELQNAHMLEVIPRPGRSNYWVPLPGKTKLGRLRSELTPLATPRCLFLKENDKLKRCTVPNLGTCTEQLSPSPEPQNVNAVKNYSEKNHHKTATSTDESPDSLHEPITVKTPLQSKPIQHKPSPVQVPNPKTKVTLTPEHLFLVEEIEDVTGDTWSRGHFINLVRETDEQTIYAALSVTREKRSLESGVNLGAYFTATLKGMTGLAKLGTTPPQDVTPSRSPSETFMVPQLRSRLQPMPFEPEPEPVDPEAMKKGWRLQYKAGGFAGMLSLVERCVPTSLDVRKLWTDVREVLPGVEESSCVDRFLDTVVTRAKHAEARTEVVT